MPKADKTYEIIETVTIERRHRVRADATHTAAMAFGAGAAELEGETTVAAKTSKPRLVREG